MNTNNQSFDINELENKLEQLIQHYNRMQSVNNTLRIKQDDLVKEKAQLIEKTNIARIRVEAMISRLKTMQHSS